MIFVIFTITKISKEYEINRKTKCIGTSGYIISKKWLTTLDEAVKIKTAIDIISTGTLNQNYTSALNILIESAVASQKKGVYSLKDEYMIYLAVDGIESVLQNEVNRINSGVVRSETEENNGDTIISVPSKVLEKKS